MKLEYDRAHDVMYIWLGPNVERAFEVKLDDSRHIDFGDDRQPIGIELLDVSMGVETAGLPERETIDRMLNRYGIKVFEYLDRVQ